MVQKGRGRKVINKLLFNVLKLVIEDSYGAMGVPKEGTDKSKS